MVELRLVADPKKGGVLETRYKHQVGDRRSTHKDVGDEMLIQKSDRIWNRWELGHAIDVCNWDPG